MRIIRTQVQYLSNALKDASPGLSTPKPGSARSDYNHSGIVQQLNIDFRKRGVSASVYQGVAEAAPPPVGRIIKTNGSRA